MLIYDGDCGFCTTSARWIERRLPADADVVAWQAIPDLGALGLSVDDVTTAAYWVDADGTTHRGHLGIGRSLETAGGAWRPLGALIRRPPIAWLAAPAYRIIAANRHRLPGATDACRLDLDAS